jgi:hypothetical protein
VVHEPGFVKCLPGQFRHEVRVNLHSSSFPHWLTIATARISVAPDPLSVAPDPLSVAPDPLSVAPDSLSVAPDPLPVAPDSLPVAPDPLPVAPDSSSIAPAPLIAAPNPLVAPHYLLFGAPKGKFGGKIEWEEQTNEWLNLISTTNLQKCQ